MFRDKYLNNLVETRVMDSDDGQRKKKQQKEKKDKKAENKPQHHEESKEQPKTSNKIKPLQVLYCAICTFPPEYCSLGKKCAECKVWLETTHPDLFQKIYPPQEEKPFKEQTKEIEEVPQVTEEVKQEEKEQPAAEEINKKKKKKKVKVKETNMITISVKQRMKNKFITSIQGLQKFDINITDAAKLFAKKYACGCCAIDDNTIEIQGDVSDDLLEYLPTKFPNIEEDMIDIKGPR